MGAAGLATRRWQPRFGIVLVVCLLGTVFGGRALASTSPGRISFELRNGGTEVSWRATGEAHRHDIRSPYRRYVTGGAPSPDGKRLLFATLSGKAQPLTRAATKC